jgi:translation elongation factor EF-Tu-like GTPase
MKTVDAVVTFLSPEQGGRQHLAWDDYRYRPHLVVGDPDQRHAIVENRKGVEEYLGVSFGGNGRELAFGVPHDVTLTLAYHPNVDYAALQPGATFTIREGGTVVGFGVVKARSV